MDQQIENEVADLPSSEEVVTEPESPEVVPAKPQRTPEEELKYFEGRAERLRTKLGLKTEKKEVAAPKPTTGELDEAQMDFFELKGYSDPDEVEVFANIMKKTGMSHREVLKDEYALSKVTKLREQKAVQAATPSSTKRGGQSGINLDAAIAKYEQTNELPDDFELRSQVIEARMNKQSTSLPPWRR